MSLKRQGYCLKDVGKRIQGVQSRHLVDRVEDESMWL